MRAGRLRHRVSIRALQPTKDGSTGQVTKTWVEVAMVFAAVEPVAAKAFTGGDQESSQVSTTVTIRWRAGIVPSMRIYHGSRTLEIVGVLPDKKSGREFLTLPCSEVERG
jgi:SPP1 family predicted phage head-tail adaptor